MAFPVTRTPAATRFRIDYRLDWLDLLAARPHHVAAELGRLLDATEGDDGDTVLAEVIARASVDYDAARLALTRVMPGLVSIAVRRARLERRPVAEVLHDVVANAWIVIRTYPIDRRPHRIAANIVRDAEYHTFVRSERRRCAGEIPTDAITDQPEPDRPASGSGELIEVLTHAGAHGVDPEALSLLGRLALTDISLATLAAEQGLSVRTLLKRRRAAELAVSVAVRS